MTGLFPERQLGLGFEAKLLHQPRRRAEAGKGALKAVESNEQGEPGPVGVMEQGQQAGGHHHRAAKGEQGTFYRHCHDINLKLVK